MNNHIMDSDKLSTWVKDRIYLTFQDMSRSIPWLCTFPAFPAQTAWFATLKLATLLEAVYTALVYRQL